jgi:hypothetical protein
VSVAHAVEDQGEQFAGGGNLGGVAGLGAAAGDDVAGRGIDLEAFPKVNPKDVPTTTD